VPPLVGYLIAGIALVPDTPGWVADAHLAPQLAEIGVMLLMFGVGTHFSLRDLLAVRGIAIPGAVAQIAVATALGMGAAHFWGWPLGAGVSSGWHSVASTRAVRAARASRGQGTLATEQGRIAVGWLPVEDLITVLALVLLPALAGRRGARPRAWPQTRAPVAHARHHARQGGAVRRPDAACNRRARLP
jgi:CPA2 family monovalent cation:H+ antiporter-2